MNSVKSGIKSTPGKCHFDIQFVVSFMRQKISESVMNYLRYRFGLR